MSAGFRAPTPCAGLLPASPWRCSLALLLHVPTLRRILEFEGTDYGKKRENHSVMRVRRHGPATPGCCLRRRLMVLPPFLAHSGLSRPSASARPTTTSTSTTLKCCVPRPRSPRRPRCVAASDCGGTKRACLVCSRWSHAPPDLLRAGAAPAQAAQGRALSVFSRAAP